MKYRWPCHDLDQTSRLDRLLGIADELESKQIHVNAVNPGPTRTRLRTTAFPAEDMRKLTRPEEITDAFVYLLSDAVTETGKTFSLIES